MRRIGKLLGLAAVAILVAGAAPDGAPVHRARLAPANAAAANGLRGAQGVHGGRAPAQPPILHASLPALAPPAAVIDPRQCRMACARPYYFCLAGEDAGSCPQTWSQCLSACDQPAGEP
jgi:hypothetical protein